MHVGAGADEGGFAWLTLNYLLGNLGKREDKTIAAIDLGGGSVQQAFAVPASEAAKAPAGYITQLSGGGRAYSVYVHRCGRSLSRCKSLCAVQFPSLSSMSLSKCKVPLCSL